MAKPETLDIRLDRPDSDFYSRNKENDRRDADAPHRLSEMAMRHTRIRGADAPTRIQDADAPHLYTRVEWSVRALSQID